MSILASLFGLAPTIIPTGTKRTVRAPEESTFLESAAERRRMREQTLTVQHKDTNVEAVKASLQNLTPGFVSVTHIRRETGLCCTSIRNILKRLDKDKLPGLSCTDGGFYWHSSPEEHKRNIQQQCRPCDYTKRSKSIEKVKAVLSADVTKDGVIRPSMIRALSGVSIPTTIKVLRHLASIQHQGLVQNGSYFSFTKETK